MWEQFLDGAWVENLANAFLVVITAFGIVISWIVGKPKTAAAKEPQRVEVDAALVDGRQAREIIRAVDDNTEAIRDNVLKIVRCESAMEALTQALNDLRLELRMAGRS